jgi:hypothetical protein
MKLWRRYWENKKYKQNFDLKIRTARFNNVVINGGVAMDLPKIIIDISEEPVLSL